MTHSASRWQDALQALQQTSEDPGVNQAVTDLFTACKKNDPDATKFLRSSTSSCLMALLNHMNSNIPELSDLSAKFVGFVLHTQIFARSLSASEASLALSNVCELRIGGSRKATAVFPFGSWALKFCSLLFWSQVPRTFVTNRLRSFRAFSVRKRAARSRKRFQQTHQQNSPGCCRP